MNQHLRSNVPHAYFASALHLITPLVAGVLFTAIPSASAVDPLNSLDPCTKAKKQLEAAISEQMDSLKRERNQPGKPAITEEQAEQLWNTLAAEEALEEIRARYQAIQSLTEDQMAQMAAQEIKNYKAKLGPTVYKEQLATLQKQATEATTSEAERQYLESAAAQREALNAACGRGEIERALRIAGAFAQKRWNSMGTETTLLNKKIKFFTDISMRDMERYGLLGGPNSDARKVGKKIEKAVAKEFDKKLGVRDVSTRTPFGGKNSEVNKIKRMLGF